MALEKFWAPVPWMLEAAIVLELVLGKYVEAAIIAALLVFNAALGLFQESRAQATLAALKSRLALNASVRRDSAWKTIPAVELVPGDVVKLSLGGVVAADVRLSTEKSCSTNRCSPANRCRSKPVRVCRPMPGRWCGAAKPLRRSRRPERAPNSAAPRNWSAPLMWSVPSRRRFCAWCAISPCSTVSSSFCWWPMRGFSSMPLDEIVPLVLTAVLASIPVALPATFTLASALGARALAKRGVLPTRLSAVDEAATMDVLVLRQNRHADPNALTVTTVRPLPGFDEAHVLALAALASSDGGQDPVDAAIRAAAADKAVV